MVIKKESAVIISQDKLSDDVYSMWLASENIASQAVAGQFISVYTKNEARLLPRPISLCQVDREAKRIRIVYRVVGCGTREFAAYQPGQTVSILGPLGNGFPAHEPGRRALIVGGGVGIPPLLELAGQIGAGSECTFVLGYRDAQLFLAREFEAYGRVCTATEDGSRGTKGNVLDAIKANKITADVLYACGPLPMLRALKAFAKENRMECYVSLEEKMACGIGACLACVCKSTEVDEHTQVKNKRICKEGPVFAAEEVELS